MMRTVTILLAALFFCFPVSARNVWKTDKIAPGLKLMSMVGTESLTGVNQHINVVEINPEKGWDLNLVAPAGKAFAGDVADSLGAFVVTTATFNFPHTYVKIGGKLISGIEIDRTNSRWWMHEAALAFDDSASFRFYDFEGNCDAAIDAYRADLSVNVISSAPLLIKDGSPVLIVEESRAKTVFTDRRYARTAMAVTDKGRILLICVDGYAPGVAEGMTIDELQRFLIKEFSPADAINMDGSAVMFIRGRGNVALPANEKPLPTFFTVTKR